MDPGELWWEFVAYVFEEADDAECPLPIPSCGSGGHTKAEMTQSQLHFDINDKILCAREWVKPLEILGILGITI